MLPQVDSLGRVFVAAAGTPVAWNSGVGYDAIGRMCTTAVVGANDTAVGAWRLDPLGRVVVGAPGAPLFYNGGLPFNSNGSMAQVTDLVPVAGDAYAGGIRVQSAGGAYFTSAVPPGFTFLDEMSIGHVLTVGSNPGGSRAGYRRGEWGDFQPNDVPNLSRLFTNLNNNRLVVQATGDWSALNISNIRIERIVPPQISNFGSPSNVIFDGVNTDFIWIVPGFDFVLGEQYEVKLS